ncbi:conserved hypothetical protein [Neisseria gonorrhoeae DGI2]|uniref:Uncharacterized protein n=1 Tax=Neisseria gonorrhoeae (strain NCCP11945) TaxID=521006 RepID=B4RRA2_NEIG2|nr:Hypothetical protein NGK_2560 [Neisseria gonorrhoeae NCCP11945]EFE03675.1 conserved hypothetical protein [Neisseria gonorrhoeae DGI2]
MLIRYISRHPKNEERQEFIGKTAPLRRHSRESGNLGSSGFGYFR